MLFAARSPRMDTACGPCSGSTAGPPTHRMIAAAREDYCRFVRNVLLRYGEVRDVVIWNEANSDTFWLPREGAPADYAALLARCWDLLHASVPGVNVLTTTASSHDPAGVHPRSSARPTARAGGSGRSSTPSGHNPYPLFPGEPPTRTARRLRRPGRLRPSGRGARRVLRRDSAAARRRSGTSRTASRRRRSESGAARTTPGARPSFGRSTPADAGGAGRRGSPARPLPASRRGVLQLPARRRVGCSEAGSPGLLWADWRRKPAFEAYRAAIAEVRSGAVDCAAVLRG